MEIPEYYLYDTIMDMNILNLALGIAGLAGFLLAVALAWVEWHRYKLPLQMVLQKVHYGGAEKDNHLILLWLAFVNPASAGKTVFGIRGGAPNSEDVLQCPHEYNRETDIVTCQLPDSDKACQFPLSELLLPPLDIPPNQSVIKVTPLLVKSPLSENKCQQVHLHLIAFDVSGKNLAEIDQTIELKTYKLL